MDAEASVLVVNAGSSSLKVKLLPQRLAFLVERIGGEASARGDVSLGETRHVRDHTDALRLCVDALNERDLLRELRAVGHRVVHGGERFSEATIIDEEVLRALDGLSALAPLHNPANLAGIRAARSLLLEVPHVAVFDTAFHSTLPRRAYLFGLPYALYEEHGIRRYGFHGPSHDYVTRRAAELLGRPREALKLISFHLGNGASAAAVRHGRSLDTTMGFTPLDGLLMGSRSGELDPGVALHLLRQGSSVDELDELLNRRSGLLGLSGVSNDMRDVREAASNGDERARAAIEVFCYRIRKTVGAYACAMGGLDAVVFTGGIGENDPATRAASLEGLEFLGIVLDEAANRQGASVISREDARVKVLLVATDEERMIADAVLERLSENRS